MHHTPSRATTHVTSCGTGLIVAPPWAESTSARRASAHAPGPPWSSWAPTGGRRRSPPNPRDARLAGHERRVARTSAACLRTSASLTTPTRLAAPSPGSATGRPDARPPRRARRARSGRGRVAHEAAGRLDAAPLVGSGLWSRLSGAASKPAPARRATAARGRPRCRRQACRRGARRRRPSCPVGDSAAEAAAPRRPRGRPHRRGCRPPRRRPRPRPARGPRRPRACRTRPPARRARRGRRRRAQGPPRRSAEGLHDDARS